MSDPAPVFPYDVEVPGLGLCTVLAPEGVAGYRVQLPSGEVQAFVSPSGDPSPENAAEDIANQPEQIPDPALAWNAFLAGFITDATTGLELKASIAACNRFSAMETLLKSAIEHGTLTGAHTVSIWDRSNVEHEMSVDDCRALLLRYGLAWQTAFNQLAP